MVFVVITHKLHDCKSKLDKMIKRIYILLSTIKIIYTGMISQEHFWKAKNVSVRKDFW